MEFDVFTLALLLTGQASERPPAGDPDPLQDAHLAHQARQQVSGELLAAGPCTFEERPEVRGMALYKVDGPTARALLDADPAVLAGRFRVELATWWVPARVIVSGTGTLPSSLAEVRGEAS
jgi:uncharacterized protein